MKKFFEKILFPLGIAIATLLFLLGSSYGSLSELLTSDPYYVGLSHTVSQAPYYPQREYIKHVWDCSNMSHYLEDYLEATGRYKNVRVVVFIRIGGNGHAMVLVDGQYLVEATTKEVLTKQETEELFAKVIEENTYRFIIIDEIEILQELIYEGDYDRWCQEWCYPVR